MVGFSLGPHLQEQAGLGSSIVTCLVWPQSSHWPVFSSLDNGEWSLLCGSR